MTNKAAARDELVAAIIKALERIGLLTPKESKRLRDDTTKK